MPHEYPKMVVSGAQHLNDAAKNVPYHRAPREKVRMAPAEKENSRVGGSSSANSKTPIPEHIHDSNAKTFYKLGQFLGKVCPCPFITFISFNILLNLGRICFLLPSYFRGYRQAICREDCP